MGFVQWSSLCAWGLQRYGRVGGALWALGLAPGRGDFSSLTYCDLRSRVAPGSQYSVCGHRSVSLCLDVADGRGS